MEDVGNRRRLSHDNSAAGRNNNDFQRNNNNGQHDFTTSSSSWMFGSRGTLSSRTTASYSSSATLEAVGGTRGNCSNMRRSFDLELVQCSSRHSKNRNGAGTPGDMVEEHKPKYNLHVRQDLRQMVEMEELIITGDVLHIFGNRFRKRLL